MKKISLLSLILCNIHFASATTPPVSIQSDNTQIETRNRSGSMDKTITWCTMPAACCCAISIATVAKLYQAAHSNESNTMNHAPKQQKMD